MIVLTSLITHNGATASLAIPAVAVAAAAGAAFVLPLKGDESIAGPSAPRLPSSRLRCAGRPVGAGDVRRIHHTDDDTATWLALTDQVLSNGRDLGGLEPRHTATVALTQRGISGRFVRAPLGVGGSSVGTDIAWAFQPYIAFAAAMLALSL
jgi:hypothetical protein